jgi:hypothetical protein
LEIALASAATILAISISTMAQAQIAYTGLSAYQVNSQNSPNTIVATAADIDLDVHVSSPTAFSNVSVSYPGMGSPEVIPYNPTLYDDGTYSMGAFHSFADLSSANSAYPFGTYTFTASDGTGQNSQSASLFYGGYDWPSAQPALTAVSYSGLQGMDVAQPYVFSFNSFTGDGTPVGLDRIDPSSNILIFNQTTGAEVYDTGALPDTTTSYVLPANTLQPGDIYSYLLFF